MATLPPTVHERLARCGSHVLVTGLVSTADVQLDVGGFMISFTASSGARNVPVPPLAADDVVRARQDAGAGFSPWSPDVIVEQVELPPSSPPLLPERVGICSHCVRVGGAVPGSRIELSVGGTVVGWGTADRHGGGCFRIDLRKFGGDAPGALTAVMEVCGSTGPAASTPLVVEQPLEQPVVLSPLFGCQTMVPLDHVRRGAQVRLESTAGPLGEFCSCWTRVDVNVGTPLTTGTAVRAQPYWDGRGPCHDDGPWSAWEPVVAPDERIAPTIEAPLIEGDQVLRVTGQIPGATRLIKITLPDSTVQEWGPAPTDDQTDIALAEPLVAGSIVTVTQTLCAVSATSDPVTVLPAPPEVFAPVIAAPLHACGARVQVSNLHAGALVRLYSDGIPIGLRWAGMASSIAVGTPSLVEGREITATQQVGAVVSDHSDAVKVVQFPELPRPRIIGPVALGDRTLLISGLTPGCRVTVTAGSTVIGEQFVAESLSRVSLWSPVEDVVAVKADLCGRSVAGDRVEPVVSPCARGPRDTDTQDVEFAHWDVPPTTDGVAFTTEMRGEVYFPVADGTPVGDGDLPLVVLAHGFWDETWWNPDTGEDEEIESFRGYDYLGHHLASWGMLVVSIDMDDVNTSTMSSPGMHTFARGEIILHAIDEILAHDKFGPLIDNDRIGILGHSMAGEGVTAAQQLNRDEGRGYALRGVVSIAPTRHRSDIVVSDTDYLQVLGSMDQLNSGAANPTNPFAGVRIYDDAERPKTHAWVHGLRHNAFNRRWVATTDFIEGSYADAAAPAAAHELVARCLIGAFLLRSVAGRAEYADYMAGLVLPQSLGGIPVYLQHSRGPRTVVDNFGDPDPQEGLADAALDGTSNSLGRPIDSDPAGALNPLEDIELLELPDVAHDTKGVHFGWNGPGARYRSGTALGIPAPEGSIAVRVAQLYDDVVANPPSVAADVFVVMRDGSNSTAWVRLGASATIPYPDHDLTNSAGPDPLAMMRTVSIPADAFTAAEPNLDLGDIRSVALVTSARPTGRLIVDDLEIWR